MSIAMKRKSCLTMTPSFCCSVLPRTRCHFPHESDVIKGTLARDGDHKRVLVAQPLLAVLVLQSSLG